MKLALTGLLLTLPFTALQACSDPDYICRSDEGHSACISRRDVRAFDPRLDQFHVSLSNAAYEAMIGDSLIMSYKPGHRPRRLPRQPEARRQRAGPVPQGGTGRDRPQDVEDDAVLGR